jgi:predicted amidophosphoribosyltransferase
MSDLIMKCLYQFIRVSIKHYSSFCILCDQYMTKEAQNHLYDSNFGIKKVVLCTLCRSSAINPIINHIKSSHDQRFTNSKSGGSLRIFSLFEYYGVFHHHFIYSKYQGNIVAYTQLIQLAIKDPSLIAFISTLPANTYVIPIPWRSQHLKQRGFSTAYELAYTCTHIFSHLNMAAHHLKRIRKTQPQVQLNQHERQHAQSLSLYASDLSCQHILLIDDVCTTGSSLLEATRACYSAGAASVHAFTLMSAL